MLKVVAQNVNRFDNFKCGEIYCETPTNYNVNCCLCGKKLIFDDFPKHFQTEHLTRDDNNGAWNGQATSEHIQDSKPPDIASTPTKDPDDIKSESEEEKPLSTLLPFYELEDEKPIDLLEIKSTRRKKDLKKIIVENLNLEACKSDDDERSDGIQSRFQSSSPAELLSLDISVERADNNEDAMSINAGDDNSIFDTSKTAESSDESLESDEAIDDEPKEDAKETNTIIYNCKECTSTYKSKRGLNNHIRVKHKNIYTPRNKKQQYKCQECGLAFSSERNLNGHMYKHTGIVCDICGKTFSQTGNMRRHRIRHSGIKSHKCAECESCFYTEKELKAHMMRHTGILPIICEICGRRCRDHGVLTAHMRRHTGERPAKCDVCGKCFYSIYDLNVHSVTHSTLRPFKCDVCGSTFQTKKALRVHKKLHSTDRKYECKICGKSFVQSGGLYSHMKTHSAADALQEKIQTYTEAIIALT